MKPLQFFMWLALTSVSSFVIGYFSTGKSGSNGLQVAHLLLVGFFIGFTITMYFVAVKTIQSSNPYLFTRVFMVSVFFKIVLLSMLVFALVKALTLVPRQLAIPLGVSYLLFTVFETWVLMRLSQSK